MENLVLHEEQCFFCFSLNYSFLLLLTANGINIQRIRGKSILVLLYFFFDSTEPDIIDSSTMTISITFNFESNLICTLLSIDNQLNTLDFIVLWIKLSYHHIFQKILNFDVSRGNFSLAVTSSLS